MLDHFLTSSILIAGIFLIRFLFGSRMQQRMKYALWLLVPVKLLMPFLSFETPYSAMHITRSITAGLQSEEQMLSVHLKPPETNMGQQANTAQGQMPGNTKETPYPHHPVASRDFTVDIFCLIWIAGACITGGSILAANIRFSRRLKSCRKEVFAGLYPIAVYENQPDAWTVHVDDTGGYFMDVTSCRQENGAYVLCGDTYADACLMLTDEEKRRLDNGVTATVTYTGMEGPCTLQKAGKTDTGQEYLLTNGQAYGMILVESQDEGQTGWVLSDPDSGMAWHPLLKTGGTITVPADTPVEVNNYYAYYDSFRNDFTMDVPDANGGQGQQWAMQLYYEYLVNVEQMAKEGHWGGMLAKIHITQKDGRMQLADMYLP